MQRGLDQLMERKEGGDMYLLWVPLIGDVRTLMMDEAHASRYLVHSGADKTYYDLRDMYGGHKYLADTNLHVHLEEIKVDKTLRFVKEPVEIIDREVESLKRSRIPIVKSNRTRSKIKESTKLLLCRETQKIWTVEVTTLKRIKIHIVKDVVESKSWTWRFTWEREYHMKAKLTPSFVAIASESSG
ncbi:hypothetical protein Tco_0586096 [Tanacetum coccineum]